MPVAQEAEWAFCLSEGRWFESRLLRSACCSVLGQDAKPRVTPDGCSIGLQMCVYEFHSSLASWHFIEKGALLVTKEQIRNECGTAC